MLSLLHTKSKLLRGGRPGYTLEIDVRRERKAKPGTNTLSHYHLASFSQSIPKSPNRTHRATFASEWIFATIPNSSTIGLQEPQNRPWSLSKSVSGRCQNHTVVVGRNHWKFVRFGPTVVKLKQRDVSPRRWVATQEDTVREHRISEESTATDREHRMSGASTPTDNQDPTSLNPRGRLSSSSLNQIAGRDWDAITSHTTSPVGLRKEDLSKRYENGKPRVLSIGKERVPSLVAEARSEARLPRHSSPSMDFDIDR